MVRPMLISSKRDVSVKDNVLELVFLIFIKKTNKYDIRCVCLERNYEAY